MKYMIFANNGVLQCIGQDWKVVQNWELHYVQGKGTCLFIDNGFICTAKEMRFVGLTDAEYNGLVNGTAVDHIGVVWTKKTVDIYGNTVITAKRGNGEIVETVLDADYKIVSARTVKP